MLSLFPDQIDCVQKLRQAYREGAKAPLLVAPCGFGKTVVFSHMALAHVARDDRRVLILVHRQELIDQVAATLRDFGHVPGFWKPGCRPWPKDRIVVGSVMSVARAPDHLPWQPTLTIIDEAHHAIRKSSWGKILTRFGGHVLGVTATPTRLSGEGLSDCFDALVLGPSTRELIDSGRLSSVRVFCPVTPDLLSVHRRGGDYATDELSDILDKPTVVGSAVEQYRKYAEGKQAVVFCVSVQHAVHVAQSFDDAGFPARAIDGSLPDQFRRDIVRDFRDKKLRVLASCDLISEGFDVPGIECGISLRPTQSLGLWLQQTGRCLRRAPGKTHAILLDHAGNALRHGLPTDDHDWHLVGSGANAKAAEARLPSVKVCGKCWAAFNSRIAACPLCGFVNPTKSRALREKDGELFEITDQNFTAMQAQLRDKTTAKARAVLINLGIKRGYKDPGKWADCILMGQAKKRARSSLAKAIAS